MSNDYIALASGVVFAAAGGELFVRGVVGLARWARVSAGIIGATVAAFATSSPEFTVSVTAAIGGAPQIALGDALGSNVVNVAFILGAVASIAPIRTPRDAVKRDFLVALSVPVVTGLLLLDGTLSRFDGALLAGLFAAWLFLVIAEARRQRSATPAVVGERRAWLALALSAIGLVLLVAAGRLIVTGATGIAASLGVDRFVIGATVVALGTSAPEIATAIVAKLRGHDEVGVGTILGSNIFNGLFIVSAASLISPISVRPREAGIALGFGLLALLLAYPTRAGLIGRRRGALLLALYAVYLVAVVHRRVAGAP